MTHLSFTVEDMSQVAEVRRAAAALAQSLGFDESRAGAVALAVTEAATNLVKHAQRGRVLIGRVDAGETAGVEAYAIDRGPGIANVGASLRDGESTAGSPGYGLGTLSRITSDFEIYTERGKGTVLHFELWTGERPRVRRSIDAAVVCVPKPGEQVSGDTWLLREEKGRCVLLVVDGLGHGPDAARAAAVARRVAWDHWHEEPAALMDRIHDALKSTRGAAAAIAVLTPAAETGVFCGVGNITCFVRAGGVSRNLVSHNGTLGHSARKIQPFPFTFPRSALLVAHSDGIGTHWSIEDHAALESRSPALIAATIYRDHGRGRDDATVAVLRNQSV